ncbi:sigma 54-interacting transcriptional regulator [Brevibacillus sp. B_LB10_24]|uniref:sigma-54 interaction domain-containing protein n=1 Tax=Brevibacillus sp. B_LB10_24 TaxID=3380645 RepID=UPI0038BDBB32
MTRLQYITGIAQDIAEAIKAAFQMDVEIVDRNIVRIAATGSASEKIGVKMDYGTVSRHVVSSQEPVVVHSAGSHHICRTCSGFGRCAYAGGIIFPIQYEGESIGTINLVAYDEEKLAEIEKNQHGLIDFLDKMSELMITKIREQELYNAQLQINKTLQTVINTIPRGIIFCDDKGCVKETNRLAQKMLGLEGKSLARNTSLPEIFPELTLEQITSGEELANVELTCQKGREAQRFLADLTPIVDQHIVTGAVVSLYDYENMKQLAFEFTNSNRKITFADIICETPVMKNIKSKAAHFARSSSTILITGESGTGKEMFARAIHEASPRADQPFISINCGAIPETLIESELFGYEKGSFTGANAKGKPGKFELANHGTIFLDEVGTMPLYLQVKLLRVIQSREIDKIGGAQSIPIDVRIIAATNSDLEEMVKKGTFRHDLYYRLNVIPIHLPPIRARVDDILPLSRYFITRYAGLLGRNVNDISEEALQVLKAYKWPGNIRELENVIEYAINLSLPTEDSLHVKHLPPHLLDCVSSAQDELLATGSIRPGNMPLGKEEYEKQTLLTLLREWGGSTSAKQRIAEVMGISMATLYRKLHFYQIDKKHFSK